MTDSLLSLLGLALKGARLAVGEEPVQEACRTGKARLVLTASDAAPNSVSRAERAAERAGIPHVPIPRSREALGAALGRRLCAVAALTDGGLAASFAAKLAAEDPTFQPPAGLMPQGGPHSKKSDPRPSAGRSN